MPVVWVHWLMARGQILKDSLVPLDRLYRVPEACCNAFVANPITKRLFH